MNAENSERKASAPQVFLSYSHFEKDVAIVERIAERLKEEGFSCWIDKDKLRADDDFNQAISDAIKSSTLVIMFMSKSYVNKSYCKQEFNVARTSVERIMLVCIDDVNENTNPDNGHIFEWSAGRHILGYGKGVVDFDDFVDGIINSVPMEAIRRYSKSGDPKDLPPRDTPEYIKARLRQYHDDQYNKDGNYALNEIRRELFPTIKDSQINVVYKDENKQEVSLIKFLEAADCAEQSKKHLMIVGEGGMGKTVSLLRTCKYLLDKGINAVYVPLSNIKEGQTLDDYLEKIVCKKNSALFKDIKDMMGQTFSDGSHKPNLVLLLDGINEMPVSIMKGFIKTVIKDEYIDNMHGVRLIMTSRWFDPQRMSSIEKDVTILEMQQLDDNAIGAYLESLGMPPVEDKKLLSVIRTPLMLTLYANVEKHKEKYGTVKKLSLEEKPRTAGKIIGNFFQTQLYRAVEETTFDEAEQFVLMDYFLPNAAYRMIRNNSMYISYSEIKEIFTEIKRKRPRYEWCKERLEDKWHKNLDKTDGQIKIEEAKLLLIAVAALHFLNEVDDENEDEDEGEKYEFLHQNFRDYFAAKYLANEIIDLCKDNDRIEDADPILEECVYSPEVLSFASDILSEEAALPYMTEEGWIFPEKNGTKPSKLSKAESILHIWKGKTGEKAQNAVLNLIEIMKAGREKLLAQCDFSGLDLRKCQLNGCRFSEWYKDKIYPSVFDGACIDRSNFLSDGHESPVTAMASGRKYLFSGDKNGTVKVFDLEKNKWSAELRPLDENVKDLAWDEEKGQLAVLYEKSVFILSVPGYEEILRKDIRKKSHSYRYVYFSEEHELQLCYNMEPLVKYDLNDNEYRNGLGFDVPVRCAKWNPVRKEYIRGNLCMMLTANRFDEETGSWVTHPALLKKYEAEEKSRPRKLDCFFLNLFCEGTNKSIQCIEYAPDGSKFLVAIEKNLLEFDSESFMLLNKKRFERDVRCACYTSDGIAAATGADIYLLDSDLSTKNVLSGANIRLITDFHEVYNDNGALTGYYLLSSGGEIKKLSPQLTVENSRTVYTSGKFVWATDRLTNCKQMVFVKNERFPYGARYTYETDSIEPLGWRYSLSNTSDDSDEEGQHWYIMESRIMMFESEPPYKEKYFTNYTGLYFYGCSFREIRDSEEINGGCVNQSFMQLLRQNGGITE